MNDNSVTPVHQIEDDEITLKELILKVKEYAAEIRRNWRILLLFIVPITAYMVYDAYTTKKTYKAELTFLINEDKGGSLGLSAALGGLGDLAGEGKSKFEKILALSKSRKIIQMSLFKIVEVDGVQDYLANHLIKHEEIHKKWESDTTGLNGFLYKNVNIESMSRTENKALLALQDLLVGKKPTYTGSYDKKSEVLKLSLVTHNEELSIKLMKVFYEDLSGYYVAESTNKEERTYKIFRTKADSLKRVLRAKDLNADRYEDQNRGNMFFEDKREVDRLKKEASIYTALYAETEKNMNVASFALESKIPYIQEIDLPIAPIKPEKKGKKLALIIGFTIGFLLGGIVIIGRKILRESLS